MRVLSFSCAVSTFLPSSSVAVDLNLNRPSVTKVVNDQHERELLNITRTWLVLFAMERASSVLVGRTLTLPDDPVASNCKNWWHLSRFNPPWDKHVSEYAEVRLTRFLRPFKLKLTFNSTHEYVVLFILWSILIPKTPRCSTTYVPCFLTHNMLLNDSNSTSIITRFASNTTTNSEISLLSVVE